MIQCSNNNNSCVTFFCEKQKKNSSFVFSSSSFSSRSWWASHAAGLQQQHINLYKIYINRMIWNAFCPAVSCVLASTASPVDSTPLASLCSSLACEGAAAKREDTSTNQGAKVSLIYYRIIKHFSTVSKDRNIFHEKK